MKKIEDVCILVQARLGSQRVPNKMLRPFAGTTLTDILFKKLKSSKVIPKNNIYFSAWEQELKDVAELLTAVTDNTDDEYIKGDATTEVLSVDTNISLKLFIKEIDKYVREQLSADGTKYEIAPLADDAHHSTGTAFWKDNQFIAKGRYAAKGNKDNTSIKTYEIDNVWVQWGWFEDNVLDKFLSMLDEEQIVSFDLLSKTWTKIFLLDL